MNDEDGLFFEFIIISLVVSLYYERLDRKGMNKFGNNRRKIRRKKNE